MAAAAAKKLPMRPRSPESKPAMANRTRSPLLGKAAGDARHNAAGGRLSAPNVPAMERGGYPSGASPGSPGLSSPVPGGRFPPGGGVAGGRRNTSATVEEIKRIDQNREQRRRAMEDVRRTRQEEAASLSAQNGGVVPDIDFHRMIRDYRQTCPPSVPLRAFDPHDQDNIIVCTRKRPIQQHEIAHRELDCVTASNPYAIVHERKFKVDGITKCLESHQFEFDFVFNEEASTEDVYQTVAQPLVSWAVAVAGRATLFAYGQTGSGKTHTMTGIQRQLAEQAFEHIKSCTETPLEVSVSFFEIYGGRPYDLLNNRQRLETLEDARNEVQIAGLTEREVESPQALLQCIELGNSLRTTHATAINRDSSRSHAVCAVFLRSSSTKEIHGKITLVDLAGSERAADSKSSIRQRRVEGAQINKSLLALKECIRAMGNPREAHVPFRASKLTLVLRDAFVSKCPSKTVMIACISPGMTSADHSVNTLRYSDRLKDHPKGGRSAANARATGDDVLHENPGRPQSKGRAPAEQRQASRRRSPSPGDTPTPAAAGSAGGGARVRPHSPQARGASASNAAPAADPADDCDDDDDDELVPDPDDDGKPEDNSCSMDAGAPMERRTSLPRRGRQPAAATLRPRDTGAPSRPDALGSRTRQSDAAARGRAPVAQPAPVATPVPSASVQTASASSGAAVPQERSPRIQSRSPEVARTGDLCQQDNRYLHNTLTSEVFERGRGEVGVVDVGVEDLDDIEHMEAVDEVRQWEDRIVSQHMVALQEDARLLTAESELLSQVQQGSNYDIDWYVSEVDKVVRRKMEVYASFLDELDVFKAQLRREETLSLSVQRNRSTAEGLSVPDAPEYQRQQPASMGRAGGSAAAAGLPPDSGGLQRVPRTPRLATME
eukprot:TRINITY_DN22909_c0_g3_i1.p1 TRINITY_DN22909_c0_g3~~TRINITY_DN22909_c0_g3_i1.p1  ORF type:complete len:892 (+),score=168.33 TRINITY_DN22909_c0_g3_i1:67-2742(+)